MPRRMPVVLLVAAVVLAGTGAAVVVRRSVTGDGPPSDPRAAVIVALAAIVGGRGENLAAPSYAGDAGARRRIVDALVAEVDAAGREEQHGAAVWHYRVTVDGDRAAGRLPEALRSEMRSWSEGQGRREVDLWLDGRERLRKLSISYADEEGRGFRVENEFWDFGGPGRLDVPDDLDDAVSGPAPPVSFTGEVRYHALT